MMVRFMLRCSFLAILILTPQLASAQVAGQTPPLSSAAVSSFLANPSQLLNQYPNGGPDLEKQIFDLMTSDKNTLTTIIALAKTANEQQRQAMGRGLANVAKAYAQAGDPLSANQVQVAVVNAGIPEFSKAYADAGAFTGTAATGGGGGAGGLGPLPTGGPNTGGALVGNTAVTNTTGLLNPGGGGGGGFSCIGAGCSSQSSNF